jgi:hypothetical protein
LFDDDSQSIDRPKPSLTDPKLRCQQLIGTIVMKPLFQVSLLRFG